MFKFFDMVVSFIETVVDFVVSLVNSLLTLIIQIGYGSSLMLNVVTYYLPNIVAGLAAVIISYAIIVNLLNKGG